MSTTTTPPDQLAHMEQLEDFFFNAAVPFAVSDGEGAVVLANRAVERLAGHEPSSIGELVGGPAELDRILGLLREAGTVIRDVETAAASTGAGALGVVVDAAPASGEDGDLERIYWSFRPVLSGAVPQAPAIGGHDEHNDASDWIARLGAEADVVGMAAQLSEDERTDRYGIIRDFFDNAPPAIHLVNAAGHVLKANPTEITILGFADAPEEYVGHHIAQIYPDPLTIEDLLSQMSSGDPTVNVRARLTNKQGDVLNVVVYSSSRIVRDSFRNTRCIVYPDASPDPQDTRLRIFDWPSAS